MAFQLIVDKNFGSVGNCIPEQQNMWEKIGGGYINSCYTTCKYSGQTSKTAVLYNSSTNTGIKFTMQTSKLTDPYSIVGVDFIYAQKNNLALRININDQETVTVSSPAYTVYEETVKLKCYTSQYTFQKGSLTLQGTINTSSFFVALDQNTNKFYIKQMRLWTNCCQNCDKCATSTTCLVCMTGFNKYTFVTGETVCEQTQGCSTANCYSCAKYGAQEVCTLCKPNYYLDGSGLCQENQTGSSCPSSTKYVEISTLLCQLYTTNCWYEYPITFAWTSCGSLESYNTYKCPNNKQVIIQRYENYTKYHCSCKISNCEYCTALNGCTSCYSGYIYNSGTQTCDPICANNQYYDSGSSSCINCGSNCSTCNSTGCFTCTNTNYYVSISIPQDCNLCTITNCQTCFGDGTCSICQSGYELSSDRLTCSIQCLVYNCQTCNATNGSICETCINNYLLSVDQSTCSCQISNCDICQSADGLKCDTCSTDYNLNSTTFECDCGIINCDSCNAADPTLCDICRTNYLLDASQTTCSCQVNNCTACETNDGLKCSTCATGYVLNTSTFQCDCGVQNCQTCNSADGSFCDNCVNNYLLSANLQQCSCQVANCTTCQIGDGQKCQNCKTGYNLNASNQCDCSVANCQTCNASNGAICDTCVNNYLISANQETCSCQVTNCSTCQVGNGQKCQTCQTNYTLNASNLCDCSVANCQTCNSSNGALCDTCVANYLISANSSDCSCQVNNCISCQLLDGLKCQTCQTGYILSNITKQCDCAVANCQTCNTADGTLCDTCINQYLLSANKQSCSCQVNNCTICEAGDGQKCSTCQTGYILNTITKQCDCSVQNCQTCNQVDGTLCDTCQFQFSQSVDHKQCNCQVPNCTSCNSSDGLKCTTCQTNYILNLTTFQCQCQDSNCITCSALDGNVCSQCKVNYSVNASFQCELSVCQVSNCQTCKANDVFKCTLCNQGLYLNTNQDQCLPCVVTNCSACLDSDYQKCNFCNVGYAVNVNQSQCDIIESSNSYEVNSKLTDTGYSVVITFTEDLVDANINENIPAIKLSIPGFTKYSYTLTMTGKKSVTSVFTVTESMKNAKLSIDFQLSKFVSNNKIVDISYIGDLPAFVIISSDVKEAVAQVSAVTAGVSKSVISSFVPIAIFGNFYFLVNMIDLTSFLYYLMFLDIRFPINVTEFYGLFKDFQFPFIPNFFVDLISPDYSLKGPQKFVDMGVDCYLINNSGSMMTICFFVIGLFIVVKVAHRVIPIRWLHSYLSRIIYETWQYSAFIDMMATVYIYILIGCFLQTLNFDTSDRSSFVVNYFLYAIWMPVCVVGPILMGLFVRKQKNLKSDQYMKVKISSYINGLRIENENPFHQSNAVENEKKQNQNQQIQNNEEGISNRDNENNTGFYDGGQIQSDNFKLKHSDDIIHELAEEEQVGSPVLVKRSRQKQGQKPSNALTLKLQSEILSTPKNQEPDVLQILQIDTRPKREQHIAKYSKMFSSYLYLRKILFSIIIVFMYGHCYIQLSLLCLLNVGIIMFIAYIQPYEKKSENVKNGVCEFILMIIQVCAFLLVDDSSDDEDSRLQIGWAIVCFSAFILLWNTVILAKDTILSLYDSFKKLMHKNDELHKQKSLQKIQPTNLPFSDSIVDEKNFNKNNNNIILSNPEMNRKLTTTSSQFTKASELFPSSRKRSSSSSIRTSAFTSQTEFGNNINNQLIGATPGYSNSQSANRSFQQTEPKKEKNNQHIHIENIDSCKLQNEQDLQNGQVNTFDNLINFSPQMHSCELITSQSTSRKVNLNQTTMSSYTPKRQRRSSLFKRDDQFSSFSLNQNEKNEDSNSPSTFKQKINERKKKSNFSEFNNFLRNNNLNQNPPNSSINNSNHYQSEQNNSEFNKQQDDDFNN